MPSSTTNTSQRNRRPASLLIVEDNADERLIIGQALNQTLTDITPVWASNEVEAIQYLETCVDFYQPLPRLVLLDIYLPDRQQGWAFLQTVKDRSWQRSMPVVALSRSSELADIHTAYDLGASSYIIKPTSLEQWLEYLNVVRTYWWDTATLPTK